MTIKPEIGKRLSWILLFILVIVLSIVCRLNLLQKEPQVEYSEALPMLESDTNSLLYHVKNVAHHQYKNSINRIRNYCKEHANDPQLQEVNGDSKWNKDLWFDYKHQLLYCQISKVSSSTWTTHLMSLHGYDIGKYQQKLSHQHVSHDQWRPQMRKNIFYLRNESFVQAKDSLLSFVFVREPFERLVSTYHNKMVRDWSKPAFDLRWMRDEILSMYRTKNLKSIPKEKPTPMEFVKYIVETAKSKGPYNLDNHIKPIWTACPFCSVDFDIIGHLETFDKDSTFVTINMDLTDKLDVGLHKNFGSKKVDEDERLKNFFSGIPKDLIKQLYDYCKRDYDMFGYPPPYQFMN